MDRDSIYVMFTMDCLPALGHDDVQGPEDWRTAERAVDAFTRTLLDEGLGATIFVAPAALKRLAAPVKSAMDAGIEAAVLCHPQLEGYQTWLGFYGFDRQRTIVKAVRERWEKALELRPSTFRPGFFSANDHTFHVLVMEGFTQGSCSLPGRQDNDQGSMWLGAHPYARHADPLDRAVAGSMEFLELPVCSDVESASQLMSNTYTPPHLRVEDPGLHDFASELVERHLDGMERASTPMQVITFVTSNVVGWGRPDDPHEERLHNLCEMLREIADRRGRKLAWCRMDELHDRWDREIRAARMLDEP